MSLPFNNRSRTARRRAAVASMGRFEALEARQLLSTFTVTSTLDDGSTGTLRWAIGQVNADTADSAASPDEIAFNIPGTGPFGIGPVSPTSPLPPVVRPVVINGYTQPGASPNTEATSDNAVLEIELTGGPAGNGLTISGGDSTVEGLAIGYSAGAGIYLGGNGGDVVEGNFLGTDIHGESSEPNFQGVVAVSSNNTIGGTTPAARNVVASNGFEDISLVNGSQDDLVQGNFVGLTASGTSTLVVQNLGGIYVDGGTGNTIGGTTPGAGNVIGGEFEAGIADNGPGGTLMEGNYVGTDPTGTVSLGNANGIIVEGSNDTIGGTVAGASNLISGNSSNGIALGGPSALVLGNLIGTDRTGTKALGNAGPGIEENAATSTIGGTSAGAGNLISGNQVGIVVQDASGDSILGNLIGTNASGLVPLGNKGDGVQLEGGITSIVIGGSFPAAANVIAFNGGIGVDVAKNPQGPAPTGASILSNSIHDNAELGIDLGGDGVTPNTPGGPHNGPNELQNFPVFTAANSSASSTTIIGTLNSTPNTTFTVQFFINPAADSSGHGQGQTYLGELTGVQTDASGNANFSFVEPINLSDKFISATATDSGGNTSEFSQDILALPLIPTSTAITSIQPSAPTFGQPITFTATVTPITLVVGPSGTITFSVDGVPQAPSPVVLTDDGFVGLATFTASGLTAGVHTITASYSGDVSFDPSVSQVFSVTVGQASTTTTLAALPDPAVVGQPLTLTAAVSGSGGTVTFTIDGVPQSPVALVPKPDGISGVATFTTTSLGAGTHAIGARYSGDSNFDPSVAPAISVVVAPAATMTTLAVAPSTANAGQPVTLTATVSGPGTLGGAVMFFDGSTPIGTAAVGQGGTAVLVLTSLGIGSHSLSATYGGDPNHLASTSNAVVEVITPPVPTGDGPKVVEVDRFGFHAMPTVLVLFFDQPMDPAGAENPANYLLVGPRRQTIRVKAAVLDPGSMAVTLSLRQRLNVHLKYTLIVNGASPGGLQGTSGLFLDGAGKGVPGSDYVAPITFRNLRGASNGHPFAVARQAAHPAPHASGHLAARHASKPRGHSR
jgi:hypothetical protein